jgi:hypothetical protein
VDFPQKFSREFDSKREEELSRPLLLAPLGKIPVWELKSVKEWGHASVIRYWSFGLRSPTMVSYTSQTTYCTFELGKPSVSNICGIFQDSGITILGGDLYLERIEFVQQLFELEDISPALHRQRMEIDFIRLIEEKQQEN